MRPTTAKSSSCIVTTVIWFLAGALLASALSCHVAAPPDLTGTPCAPDVDYHWNCGLNVGYITLRLFDKNVDIYRLADELKAGPHLERNISLLDLKIVFEKYGLIAEGYKADCLEEIITFAQPEIMLIVRLDSRIGQHNLGHFLLIKGGPDHVLLIDPPHHPKKFRLDQIIEAGVISSTTGEFLVVYEPQVGSSSLSKARN